VAPVLLCRAAPVTLLLRALPAAGARRVTRLLGWRPVRVVTHPLVAAALDAGGLWLLYATDLYPRMHASPVVHLAVHAHVLVAGYLFTASVVGVDPDPHRPSLRVRLLVLVLFTAAHAVLAKWLYAHPPDGVAVDDAERGSQLMYYGGDAVHLVLFVLLLRVWYDAGAPGVGRHHLPGGQRGRPLGWSRAARALLPGGSRSRPRGAGRGRPPGGQVPAA